MRGGEEQYCTIVVLGVHLTRKTGMFSSVQNDYFLADKTA